MFSLTFFHSASARKISTTSTSSDFHLVLVQFLFWSVFDKNFSCRLRFFSFPFSSLHKASKWYTCGGAFPEPDRLPSREKGRFDDFPMFGVEWSHSLVDGRSSFWASLLNGANRAAKVLLTGWIVKRRWAGGFWREDAGVEIYFSLSGSPSLYSSAFWRFTVAQYMKDQCYLKGNPYDYFRPSFYLVTSYMSMSFLLLHSQVVKILWTYALQNKD